MLLIFLYLALVYRHLHAVSPLVPIIAIIGWNAVAMYLLGIAYTPLTATLGSMTIGVAAEYTILVMERYAEEEERLHHGLGARDVLWVLCAVPREFPYHLELRDNHAYRSRVLAHGRDLRHASYSVACRTDNREEKNGKIR